MSAPRRIRALAGSTLLVAGLALGACSAGDPGVDEPDDATLDTLDDLGDATEECLVGTWNLSNDELSFFYDAVAAESEGMTIVAHGGVGYTFQEDGHYVSFPGFILELGLPGDAEITADVTGRISGDYSADGGILRTRNDIAETTTTFTMDGEEVDMSDAMSATLTSLPINEAPYDCVSHDELVVHFSTASSRIPVRLERVE